MQDNVVKLRKQSRGQTVQLEAQVAQLHSLRTQLKAIQGQERELTQAVIGQMQHWGLAQVDNCNSRALMVRSERLNIQPPAFKKKVSRKDFMACISVSTSKAREVLGARELRAVSEITPAYSLRVSEIKKAAQTSKVSQAA